MKSSIFTLFVILLSVLSQGFAVEKGRNFTLTGKVLEKESREPIEFANIGVENTFIGTASNLDGFFELRIPDQVDAEFLYVSAIGYGKLRLSIEELKKLDFINLEMIKQTYYIEDVHIEAQSREAYGILNKAAKKIGDNYVRQPYSAKAYYNNTVEEGSGVEIREAIVEISDRTGYYRETPSEAFKNRNYQFMEASRSFEVVSLEDGRTRMDELLEFDIVRNPSNILEIKYLNYFDLKLEDPVLMGKDSVWVIAYHLPEPLLSATGDFYATSYNGRIYVRKKDYAILMNETRATSSAFNRFGRSLAIDFPDIDYNPVEFYYDFKTTYRNESGRYCLDRIISNRTNKWTDAHGVEQKQIIRSELMILETNVPSPAMIHSREYIENTPADNAFWSRFVKPGR